MAVRAKQRGATPEARHTVRRRVSLECAVLADLWDEPLPHQVTDLSEDGLWIETDLPLEVGTEVTVAVTPPDWNEPLYASGEVRRVNLSRRSDDPRSAGMGIAFEALRPDDRKRLGNSLRGLAPMQPLKRTERTLAGVPVGPSAFGERRVLADRTLTGFAPPLHHAPPVQQRRLAPRQSEHRAASDACFGGGLSLATWVFTKGTGSPL